MLKNSLIVLLFISSLFAQDATQEQLNDICQEAILFIAIFGVMGIISYTYSSRHAKEYKPTQTPEEEKVPFSRTDELYEMLKTKHLREEEFDILKAHYEAQSYLLKLYLAKIDN